MTREARRPASRRRPSVRAGCIGSTEVSSRGGDITLLPARSLFSDSARGVRLRPARSLAVCPAMPRAVPWRGAWHGKMRLKTERCGRARRSWRTAGPSVNGQTWWPAHSHRRSLSMPKMRLFAAGVKEGGSARTAL